MAITRIITNEWSYTSEEAAKEVSLDLKVTDHSVDEGVAWVRFNRPGRGNSWTARMNAEYRWIMARLDEDPDVRVIVVTGAGRQFCVGADFKALDHYADTGSDYVSSLGTAELARPGHGVRPEYDHDIVWQWGLRKPVIAAINGSCAGMGLAIAAFSDFRYAVAGAKITTAAAKVALPAEYGMSWLLPRIIGLTHAADWLISGRIVLAEEALRVGFLNAVLPEEAFQERIAELAQAMARSLSPMAAAVTKRQLYADLMSTNAGAAVDESKRLIGVMMKTADFKEGARAMQERRPPVFEPLPAATPIPQPAP